MKLVRLTSFIAPLLAFACGSGTSGKNGQDGAPGAPGEPGPSAVVPERTVSINMIEPHVGLVARQLEVRISTDGKLDLSNAKVDFGDGVDVLKVTPKGSALSAIVEIAPNAKLGKHDVVVTADGQKLTAKQAFVVAVPLDAKVSGGKAEQGGLVRLDISNRDNIWFDAEKFRLFPLASQKDATLIPLAHQRFTITDGSVVLLGDPLAKTGPLGFVGFNDPTDQNSPSFLTEMDAVTVTSRTPIALTPGTPVEKTFANELETAFYSVDVPAPRAATEGLLVEAWANVPADSTMKPMILAYPASGKVGDVIDQGVNDPGLPSFGIPATDARVAYPVTTAAKGFLVVLDAQLGYGPTTKMTLNYSVVRGQLVNEKPAKHESTEEAQSLGTLPGAAAEVPARIVSGELTAADEVDVYKLGGLPAATPVDMLVSVMSDADVVVLVDTVPTFDSENVVEVTRGGTAGMTTTANFVGKDRFIQVTAKPDSSKQTGKYTLAIKRLARPVAQP